MACLWYLFLASLAHVSLSSAAPQGHLEPLGRHRPPTSLDELNDPVHPKIFFENYVKQRKPLVIRNGAKNFPAFKLWTNEYLKSKYGHLRIKLETKNEKAGELLGGIGGLGHDTIGHFIDNLLEKDAYVVSQMPDPMTHEVFVSSSLMCGTFKNRILEANFWLSSGDTKSILHKDADNNINCLLDGVKEWVFVHPKFIGNGVPMATEPNSEIGGFSLVNVHRVDLLKFPEFANVEWQNATVRAGDCVYIPWGYLHQVHSLPGRNMAAAILFGIDEEFDETGCEETPPAPMPLDEVDMAWGYPGYGPMTMGNADPELVRRTLIQFIRESTTTPAEPKVTHEQFIRMYVREVLDIDDSYNRSVARAEAKAFLNFINCSESGFVSVRDILPVEKRSIMSILKHLMSEDPANTDDYEFYVQNGDNILSLVRQLLLSASHLQKGDFISHYKKELRGTEFYGGRIFDGFDENRDGILEKEEFNQSHKAALKEFYSRFKKDDPANLQYEKELEEEKLRNKNTKHASTDL